MIRDAIVLAAGMGTRLRPAVDDRPKGLLEIDGEPIVGRSLTLLRDAGVHRVTIVAGYRAEMYRAFAAGAPDVRLVLNPDFATAGSMASLAVALDAVTDADVLVLESDIVYERRALDALVSATEPDATLVSGPTGAGDEVWVYAPDGMLHAMSKTPRDLPAIDGEFVGITRLSAAGARELRAAFGRHVAAHAHGRMDYETGALVEVARQRRIAVKLIADLCWGEIDDAQQYARVVERVLPAVKARDTRVQ